MRRTTYALGLVAIPALLVMACGQSGSGEIEMAMTDVAALRSEVEAVNVKYVEAYNAGDAAALAALMEGSQIREGHRNCEKVQDPYSLRCFPQVLGAVIDAVGWIRSVLEIECNAATDNPLIVGTEGRWKCSVHRLTAPALSCVLPASSRKTLHGS